MGAFGLAKKYLSCFEGEDAVDVLFEPPRAERVDPDGDCHARGGCSVGARRQEDRVRRSAS